MDKKDIKDRYENLVKRIEFEKIYDGRGLFDLYECEDCGANKITTYRDKGITPFMIKCACGKYMEHTNTYKSVPNDINVEEWVRPTLEEAYKLDEHQLEYLFNGGLFLKSELNG